MDVDYTLGGHIYAIVDAVVYITESYFLDGTAKLGGAIYAEGNATIYLGKSTLQGNSARLRGGAIYASGVALLYLLNSTKLTSNTAYDSGDDIFALNSDTGYLRLDSVTITNPSS